jgi:hypothetical protein
MTGRAGHCTCGLGRSGNDLARDVMFNRGGMVWCIARDNGPEQHDEEKTRFARR